MQETISTTNKTQFVFRPKYEVKTDFITNDYLKKMPRDENLRYELIGGEIIISTSLRYIHQLVSARIMMTFFDCLKVNSLGLVLGTVGLIFSDFDGVIPDLIYISHEKIEELLDEESGKFYGSPEIVIEILSPGRANARRDLQVKREIYEIYEVPEYWVVDPFEKVIIVFQHKKGNLRQTKTYKEKDTLKTKFLPEFKLDIKKLFVN